MVGGTREKAVPNLFASALLNENCIGGKVLTDETRAALENLISALE
jgi:hypothetical protein